MHPSNNRLLMSAPSYLCEKLPNTVASLTATFVSSPVKAKSGLSGRATVDIYLALQEAAVRTELYIVIRPNLTALGEGKAKALKQAMDSLLRMARPVRSE
jgi:hypothetical protein